MDIQAALLKEHSKAQMLRIVEFIGDDKMKFRELMTLFLKGEYRITQRAAWAVCHCALKFPALIRPYFRQMIDRMKDKGVHVAVRRNIVRILQDIEIPEQFSGEIYELCFGYLRSVEEPVAVRALSLSVVEKIARGYPELREELTPLIEDMIPFSGAAIASRGRKVLKQLKKRSLHDPLRQKSVKVT